MLLQVRTDNHIGNSQALAERVRAEVESALQPRFGEQLRRVEVYFQDVNSHKGGTGDIRCAIEAHLAGHQPVTVEARADNTDGAVGGALDKLLRALDGKLGRLSDRGGRVSMSGDET